MHALQARRSTGGWLHSLQLLWPYMHAPLPSSALVLKACEEGCKAVLHLTKPVSAERLLQGSAPAGLRGGGRLWKPAAPQGASRAVLLGDHVGGRPGRLPEGCQLVCCHPVGHGHVLRGVHVGDPFGGGGRRPWVGAGLGSHLLVLLQEGRMLRMLQRPGCGLPRLQLALHKQQSCEHQSGQC